MQDCSAATQNLLLAAHAVGVGAVWTGIYPIKDRIEGFRKAFGLPEHVIPLAFVPIGYPAQTPDLRTGTGKRKFTTTGTVRRKNEAVKPAKSKLCTASEKEYQNRRSQRFESANGVLREPKFIYDSLLEGQSRAFRF
ncbi:MAG: nitroreductase family protein [Methanosarcina barkeri]|nr:nitroreductase family protein [Methanosarcina sp. ERenArc_MAG2]